MTEPENKENKSAEEQKEKSVIYGPRRLGNYSQDGRYYTYWTYEVVDSDWNTKYYDVSIVDNKEEKKLELEFIPEDLTKPEIILGTLFVFLIFW